MELYSIPELLSLTDIKSRVEGLAENWLKMAGQIVRFGSVRPTFGIIGAGIETLAHFLIESSHLKTMRA